MMRYQSHAGETDYVANTAVSRYKYSGEVQSRGQLHKAFDGAHNTLLNVSRMLRQSFGMPIRRPGGSWQSIGGSQQSFRP